MIVSAWLPIIASGKFYIEVDEDKWNSLTDEQKLEEFLADFQSDGNLCHHCSSEVQTDFEYIEKYVDELTADDLRAEKE